MSFIKKDISHDQLKDMVLSLESQLIALYDERAKHGTPEQLSQTVANLTEQLQSFYWQQEKHGTIESLAESLKNFEDQLASFYHDVEHTEYSSESEGLHATVSNLEKQVIALIDEKTEIEQLIDKYNHKMKAVKDKSRELGAALFEAALFEDKFEHKKVS